MVKPKLATAGEGEMPMEDSMIEGSEGALVDREQLLNAMHKAQDALKIATEFSGMTGRATLQTILNLAGVPVNMDKELVNRETIRAAISENYEAIRDALKLPKWIPMGVGIIILSTCLLVPGVIGSVGKGVSNELFSVGEVHAAETAEEYDLVRVFNTDGITAENWKKAVLVFSEGGAEFRVKDLIGMEPKAMAKYMQEQGLSFKVSYVMDLRNAATIANNFRLKEKIAATDERTEALLGMD